MPYTDPHVAAPSLWVVRQEYGPAFQVSVIEPDDLGNHLETTERAEEIDAKIEQTDQLIDEIVYEPYGLSVEEFETVQSPVED